LLERTSIEANRGEHVGPPACLAPAWVEWALLAALIALFVAKGLVPAWSELSTDFPNYYIAGRLYRAGYPLERLYDWIWIQRQKDHLGLDQPLVGYVPLTLFSALVVAPLSVLPALAAKRCWLVINLLLLVGIGWMLKRMTALRGRQVALVIFAAVVPLRTNFGFGQQHLLLLFVLTIAAWLYFQRRDLAAGVVLSAAAALKLYPAMLALLFLRKRRWRALAGLALGSVGVALLAVALFGWEPMRVYAREILPRAVLRAEVTDPYSVHLSSFTGLLRRLLVYEPELNPHPLAHAPALFSVLQPLCGAAVLFAVLWAVTARDAGPAREKLDLAAFVAFVMLFSSATASYHYCLLILAAVLGTNYLLETGRPRQARGLVVLFAVVCFPYYGFFPASPDGWRSFLGYPRFYATLAFCVALWQAQRASPDGRPPDRSPTEKVAFGIAFAAFVALGTVSNLRHLRGQFDDYPRRLATGSLHAAQPAVAGDEIFFSSMGDGGYVIDRRGGASALEAVVPAGTDLFHPAVSARDPDGWMEVAGRTSRVARFPRDARSLSVASLPIEVDDGESPAISPDGRWLAFIRPERGRGALWVVDRRAAAGGSAGARQREIVGAERDVREMAFAPDGRIVFSAGAARPRLTMIDPASGAAAALDPSDRPRRYPAISPDGRFLAYSERDGANWQLWVAAFPRGDRRCLTDADCNAISPAWRDDSRTIVYATDCGRGLGHSALAWIDRDARP
jgi:hypothetical protein